MQNSKLPTLQTKNQYATKIVFGDRCFFVVFSISRFFAIRMRKFGLFRVFVL
jgi:hypothetical protein